MEISEMKWKCGLSYIIIIIIIISGSTVLVRTLAASHRRFPNLIRTHGRTPLDQ
jgi:hypothetical protein